MEKLKSKGIENNRILNFSYFGTLPQFNYTYFMQFKILKDTDIKIDFFVTGISCFRWGIDLMSMQPFRGINFARSSQDLYYSYKMAEAYIKKVKSSAKFCLIGFTPYIFNHWLDKTYLIDRQMFYFPILGHENMEYHGTKRGQFIETIFEKKYKSWYEHYSKTLEGQPFNLADIDGFRQWHRDYQHDYRILPEHYLNAADDVGVHEHKIYPETIERNKEVLKKYINLCRENNIVPIGLLLPYSKVAHKHYPKNSLDNFLDTLKPFQKYMHFINLWDMELPDDYFEDPRHLNMRGSVEVTKVIKEVVTKILQRN